MLEKGDCQFERLIGEDGLHYRSTLLQIALSHSVQPYYLPSSSPYKEQKTGVPIWGHTARRLTINVTIPMLAGGCFIYRMMDLDFCTGSTWLVCCFTDWHW
jgi:hypothetical protein